MKEGQAGVATRAPATGEPATARDQGAVAIVIALLQSGTRDPKAYASIIELHPHGRTEVLALLHAKLGNTFVAATLDEFDKLHKQMGAQDVGGENPFAPIPPHQRHSDSVKQLEKVSVVAEGDANSMLSAVLPGYVNARDALDSGAVAELGGRALAGFVRMRVAREALSELDKRISRRSEAGATAQQDLDDATTLESVEARRDGLNKRVDDASLATFMALTPHRHRGVEVAGAVPQPSLKEPAEELRARLAGELLRTVEMLDVASTIRSLVNSKGDRIESGALDRARGLLLPWSTRPIDLAFLKAILGEAWGILDATAPPGTKPSAALDEAAKQASHTGWFSDLGEFNIHDAEMWIRLGGHENAERVRRKLYTADPDTRGKLLLQMKQRRILEPFLDNYGWEAAKELHDSLASGHAEVKSALQLRFLGGKEKWGPSLGQEWDSHDTSLHHYVAKLGVVGDVLNFVGDLATFGVHSSYGKAHDAHASGQMSDDAYGNAKKNIVLRTIAVSYVSLMTGGLADKVVRGGATTTARVIAGGAAGGSVGGVAGLAVSDTYNVLGSHEQDGFSSPETYIKTALLGAGIGGAMGRLTKGLSDKSASYLPEKGATAGAGEEAFANGAEPAAAPESTPASVPQEPQTAKQAAAAERPPPTMEEIVAMEEASVGDSLKLARGFVQNPNTIYHHYLNKGGVRSIAESSSFRGGDGTASFGGERSVRAWIGEVAPGAAKRSGNTVIEFTSAGGEVPDVRLYQSRPGAYLEGRRSACEDQVDTVRRWRRCRSRRAGNVQADRG